MLNYRTNVDITSPVVFKDQLTYFAIIIQRKWRSYKRNPCSLVNMCVQKIYNDSIMVAELELSRQIYEFNTHKQRNE